MKKTILAWLMILAVLLSFAGCGSEQDENFAGGDTEIHEAEKLPEKNEDKVEEEGEDTKDPTQADTPVDEPSGDVPKEEEQKPSEEEQKPSAEENKEEQKPSEDEQKPSTEEEQKPADQLPGAAVSYYATYQKVHQLQAPDGLEALALTYARNSRALFRFVGMEDLQAFESIADPYFQFTDAMEQGEQDGSVSDELLGDDAPSEKEEASQEPAIGFMEGLTGNVYGDSFFQQKSILLIYNVTSGKSNSGKVTAVRKDGNKLLVYLDVTPQANQTADQICRFIGLEFSKADIAECEIFQIVEVDQSKK